MAIDMRELGVLRPATPCASKWTEMDGDRTVRRCRACQQNVYRFGDLDAFAARELLLREEGKLCVRFYARKDGTVLTRDCSVATRRRSRLRWAAISALLVALFGGLGFVADAGGVEPAERKVLGLLESPGTRHESFGPPHDESQCKCMHDFVINNNY